MLELIQRCKESELECRLAIKKDIQTKNQQSVRSTTGLKKATGKSYSIGGRCCQSLSNIPLFRRSLIFWWFGHLCQDIRGHAGVGLQMGRNNRGMIGTFHCKIVSLAEASLGDREQACNPALLPLSRLETDNYDQIIYTWWGHTTNLRCQ